MTIMCKVLKRIHNKTATQLLKESGTYNTLPVDIVKIAKHIGISIIPSNMLDIPINGHNIISFVISNYDNAAIYYKEDDTYPQIRFTIAHELAHCCDIDPIPDESHIEYKRSRKDNNELEERMDRFAEELLIPYGQIIHIYNSLILPDLITLAKLFAVPVKVMKNRLDHLRISYLDEERKPVFY